MSVDEDVIDECVDEDVVDECVEVGEGWVCCGDCGEGSGDSGVV